MNFILTHILTGIFFLEASFCSTQEPGTCNSGSQCRLLSSCSEMEDLMKSGNSESIQMVRNSSCGSVGEMMKVCCPTTPITLIPTKCGRPASDDKIINGKPAPFGAYPWMAALGYTEPGNSKVTFRCAGAIISEKYVLTAAHCLYFGRKRLSVIHLGDYNLATEHDCMRTKFGLKCFTPHIVAGVEDTVSHLMYKRGSYSYDIALIRLNTTLNFDNSSVTIEPVCLPPNGFNFKSFSGNGDPVAAGWGLTEHGNQSDILLRVSLPIADDALCKERYEHKFSGNQLCIGGTKERFDTCTGDSGGPLVMSEKNGPPFFQVGIVSFGPLPCGLSHFPGVYTNVAAYRDWIIDNMKP